ncbi:MAG: GH92 family glycosyl hydrolase [Bacteroidota bacterium]
MLFTKRFTFLFVLGMMMIHQTFAQQNLSKLVNPFVGTGGHGHTFPGAVVPFGMVQLSPDTRVDGSWDGCSGYHYSDSVIYGFSHTHLSGTGCSDYGDIMLMPVVSEMKVLGYDHDYINPKNYQSKFSHTNEKATAGYYSVMLDKYHIKTELTTTTRVGLHKYTFPKTAQASLVMDLTHRDELLNGMIEVVNDSTVRGYRYSKAWARDQRVFFYMKFSKKMKGFRTGDSNQCINGNKMASGKMVKGMFIFETGNNDPLLVKVAISGVDMEGARKNMEAELQHWNFDKVKADAEGLWNKELGRVKVKGGTAEQQAVFYTALYHCFIHPSIASDVDGRYLGRDFTIHQTDGFNYYTVFSLWDTFRALHPLFNVVQRERNLDFIKTFLAQYQHSGRLPMWELSSNETNCMIAYHSVSVIADAYAKGIRGFDVDLAIKAGIDATKYNEWAIPKYHQKGFLEIEDEHESVSKNLEYAYDDWCISKLISDSKREVPEYAKLVASSQGWQHIYNSRNHFFQPRSNGGWYQPFKPSEVNNHYTEANAWQYSLFVPHDMDALQQRMLPSNLENRLDALFTAPENIDGRQQADITGMIGQYAHGNEPSHNFAYLYTYAGKPEKTKQRIKQIINELYHNAPDGLSGNEDCGQMSAWYVFSAMGFYPVCPGKNEYVVNESVFDEVIINGQKLDLKKLPPYQYHTPEGQAGAIVSPVIEVASKAFRDSILVTVYNRMPGNLLLIHKRPNDKAANSLNIRVAADSISFYVKESITIEASVENKAYTSVASSLFKKPNKWSATLARNPNRQYTAGGSEGLIDGIYGDENWRKGNWQGYQTVDAEVIIDLKESQTIRQLTSSYLQDSRSWILFPKEVEYFISTDGIRYTAVGKQSHSISPQLDSVMLQRITLDLSQPVKARYVKVVAKNFGKLPAWHQGFGDDAFIFVDEIEVK